MKIQSWQKFDTDTQLLFQGDKPFIDHAGSAVANLKRAGKELAMAPLGSLTSVIPSDVSFYKPLINKIGEIPARIVMVIAGPFYLLGSGLKNAGDAAAHGAAALFTKPPTE